MRFLRPILLLIFVSLSHLAISQIANADELTTDEDVTASINVLSNDFSLLGINAESVDLDPSADDLQKTITTDQGTFTVDDSGVVTFVPIANESGQTNISYTFRDLLGFTSNKGKLTVAINPVNDVPHITGQNPVTMQEDGMLSLAVNDVIVDDPDDKYPKDFSLIVQNGNNYTVTGTTITPAADFAGTLTVPVTVHDGDAESNVFDLQVTVTPVNDAPIITGQAALETSEDTPITLVLENLQVTDMRQQLSDGLLR